jgi:hypothetical protein
MAFKTRTAMRTKRSIKWGLVAAAVAFAAVAATPGCELLVNFDRSKIPQEGGDFDATTPEVDGTSPESSTAEDSAFGDGAADAPSEGSTTDALPEAAAEAGAEAGVEAGTEAGVEGGGDSGPDAPVDTGAAVDAPTDSGEDGG